MENIFSYYDYRKFLDDFYREKKLKDSFFSLRYMSRKIGVDHGLIVKILQGQRPKILAFSEVSSRRVDVDKYEFYRRWYYTAVREIITIRPFNGDFGWLGRMLEPQITTAEARNNVAYNPDWVKLCYMNQKQGDLLAVINGKN